MTTRPRARWMLFCLAALGCAGLGLNEARGDLISASPGLPPTPSPPGGYLTAGQVHAYYAPLGLTISEVDHTGFNSIQLIQGATGPGGTGEQENFNSVLYGLASINGSPNVAFTLLGSVSVIAYGRTSDSDLGTFNTQMLSMDMTGIVGGYSVVLKLDPANPTLGQTTISNAPNGMFRIDSFFDVFTEISLDGGSTYTPQSSGAMVSLQTVPEPSSLVIGATASVIGLACVARRRRRQTRSTTPA